jgi:hypothetical protein
MKTTLLRIAGAVVILGLPVFLLFFFLQDRGDADGHIEVKTARYPDHGEFNQLVLDGVDYGLNYHKPERKEDWGKPDKDRSRLATTYYHHKSPVGLALQQYDWFGEWNTANRYASDARLPASLVGLANPLAPPAFVSPVLAGMWSEPAIGVIGLNCGTIASYARPYQHIHFFERNPAIAKLSLPPAGEAPKFHFVQDAMKRGALVQVLVGKDERQTLANEGPDGFYRVLVVETARAHPDRPVVKRLSREAMNLYAQKLAPAGIICYHTSSRIYDLAPLLGDIAKDLGLVSVAGHVDQQARNANPAFYPCDWVLVARRAEDLARIKTGNVPLGSQLLNPQQPGFSIRVQNLTWSNPVLSGKLVMTDDTPKMIRGARRP